MDRQQKRVARWLGGTGNFDVSDNMVKNGRWRRDRRELAPETVPPRPSDEGAC
jgi:hypothetical protein